LKTLKIIDKFNLRGALETFQKMGIIGKELSQIIKL